MLRGVCWNRTGKGRDLVTQVFIPEEEGGKKHEGVCLGCRLGFPPAGEQMQRAERRGDERHRA